MIPRIVAALVLVQTASHLTAAEPAALSGARKEFEKAGPHPAEAVRSQYIVTLRRMREGFAQHGTTPEWQAVDAELIRHPEPKSSDAKASSALLIGKWSSPRHDYFYKKDGTWVMLPDEKDATGGQWRIEGNRWIMTVHTTPPSANRYTIILIDKDELIFTDGEVVFYEKRMRQ